jgi:hypothetical protein
LPLPLLPLELLEGIEPVLIQLGVPALSVCPHLNVPTAALLGLVTMDIPGRQAKGAGDTPYIVLIQQT